MLETSLNMPVSFWVVIVILLSGGFFAFERIRYGIGLPMLAVFATTAVWYVVDLFYNSYDYFTQTFSSQVLSNAWWQVALFLAVFSFLAPELHKTINARYLNQPSSAVLVVRSGVNNPFLQQRLTMLFEACLFIWAALSAIAAVRLQADVIYYFFPFLAYKMDPWARDRLGAGFDSLLALAGNLQLFSAAAFGISAALLTNRRLRAVAIAACVFAWPYYIFSRTRNSMLSSVLPGLLAWVIVRMRSPWLQKSVVLAAFFFLTNVWFGFIIANRDNMTITEALQKKGFSLTENANVHHNGLNMFEELCWANTLTTDGSLQLSWGSLYFAELVSPIPRALWPGKPTPTLAYSVARGQAHSDTGEGATISTGMIGQGVVSFGTVLGPAFAAFLMSVWAVILARLDLRGQDLMLFGFGLILTFNLGRDITTITLYTFIFGSAAIWLMNRLRGQTPPAGPSRSDLRPRHLSSNV